ncbi:hypothetical protein J6590_082509 [Homalodisca vitripennis]|nr:hypothetical protein J6590_082509 [Homalodisca vitripennis]
MFHDEYFDICREQSNRPYQVDNDVSSAVNRVAQPVLNCGRNAIMLIHSEVASGSVGFPLYGCFGDPGGLSSHLLGLSSLSLYFSELTLLAFFLFSTPHYGCPSTFFRTVHAGESWECPCLVAGTDVCLALPMALSSVLSEASYFGSWSGSAAWMQGSDSALPRATPSTYGTLCVSVVGKRRFGPRRTGVGASSLLREEDLQGYTRSRPMNLAAPCRTMRWSNGKEKEQAAFKRSSIMQRSLTLTTGTPMRELKTSPPPVPFKAVSDTGSSSGSGKRKEEVDLAMEVTNLETPQTMKEGIPPSKSPLRAAFGLQMLRQQHDDASEEEDLSLNKMKALLKEMARALLTQRNVNKAIKDGIPKLDDFLGEIEECRKISLKAVKQEREIMNRVLEVYLDIEEFLCHQERRPRDRPRSVPSGAPRSVPSGALGGVGALLWFHSGSSGASLVLRLTKIAQMNDKDWTVQKRLLSARRASQMAVFDNEIERWGEVDVPYLHLSSSEVIVTSRVNSA